MIGAKTIASLTLLVVMTWIVFSKGYLNPDHLARINPYVAVFMSIFALLSATMIVHIWRLYEKSKTSFRYTMSGSQYDTDITLLHHLPGKIKVGEIEFGRHFDIPPIIQKAIYTVVFLFVGLLVFDMRSLDLLGSLPDKMSLTSSRFCEEEKEEKQDPKAPEAQGCELVKRAFKLGYAKSLGSCGKKKKDKAKGLCTLRQLDEPYLHYAWRLFYNRVGFVVDMASAKGVEDYIWSVKQQWSRFATLYDTQKYTVKSDARASHHLWTNLPFPRSGFFRSKDDLGLQGHCTYQYSGGSVGLGLHDAKSSMSDVFEKTFGRLLFSPSYKPVVGLCQEYVIHWDAPYYACRDLAENPEAFLAAHVALKPVRHVITRHKRAQEFTELKELLATRDENQKRLLNKGALGVVQQIVSFQCYMVQAQGAEGIREHSFALDGHPFQAFETIVGLQHGHKNEMKIYHRLAALLSQGFRYGRLMSQSSHTMLEDPKATLKMFDDHSFLLSQLEYLRNLDLFVDDSWLDTRADLLPVYPFHLHLRNFVEVFRRQYKMLRGRL